MRLFHTLRWLGVAQLAALLRHRIALRFEVPRLPASSETPDPGRRWSPELPLPAPDPAPNRWELLRAGRFVFLSRAEELGWPPPWEAGQLPRLWQYQLHYFDWLWAVPFAEATRVALDWIECHPLARGRVGWEPYPISLRVMNWCAYFFGTNRANCEAQPGLCERLWSSLCQQLWWLERHLETHLRANHLLENAAALALAGACFRGARAEGWRDRGLALLARELPEQFLPDGGHIERSPMYHARAVHILALLAASGDPKLGRLVEKSLQRARRALALLCHPDGEIALLNDSALGPPHRPVDLVEAPALAGVFALPETGYYGARESRGDYLVCDAAPIGPDYNPGHAHGDLFSFELSLEGLRVVCDAGVFGYEDDALRAWCRSTRAHNTVEIEGEDQCEFWGVFRVARRARPHDVRFEARPAGFALEGWHDGYGRLPGSPRHTRRLRWHAPGVLLVVDRVEARRPVVARSRVHLHPECEIVELEGGLARLRRGGVTFSIAFAGDATVTAEDSIYCPAFGGQEPRRALVQTLRGDAESFGFCIVRGHPGLRYDLARGATVDEKTYAF